MGDPSIVGMLYSLVVLIPGIVVAVRRLHDIDHSGWLFLIVLIPFGAIILIVLMVQDGTQGQNQYSANPKEATP